MYVNCRRFISAISFALVFAGVLGLPAEKAQAAKLDCSQPFSSGSDPTAVDCLFILKVAVGSETGDPECVSAPKGTLPAVATDALLCLQRSVGIISDADLNCPCGGRIDLQDPDFDFDPSTDVVDFDIRPSFTQVDYIGAFPQNEDPATGDWTLGWTISLHKNNTVWEPATGGTLNGGVPSANGACPAGTTDIGNTALPGGFAGSMDICQLASRYDTPASTITLTNDNIYQLASAATQGTFIGNGDAPGKTPVGGADPAVTVTLNIEPGTLILGDAAAALSVTRGSNINVNGTAVDPVVMSSLTWFNAWLAGGDGRSDRGEWGGLVITGFATANQCNNLLTCDALVEGFINPFNYGGFGEDDDDSGSISYLIIRQGGFDLDGNGSEINGLTLYTIGYNTNIDHVQVHENVDDGIEFFGGKVVVTHAVLTGVGDDSIDSDLGFTGGVQFAVVKQFDDLADRGFEADSSGNPLDTPVSAPTYANVTVLGNQGSESQSTSGMIARSTTGGYWWNGIFVDSERSCIRMDDDTLPTRGGVLGNPNDGTLQIHNYVVDCATNFEGSGGAGETDADVSTWYLADINNRIEDPRLGETGYPSTTARYFGPEYAFDPSTDVVNANIQSSFSANSFVGAFDQSVDPATGDWTRNWTIALHGNNTVWEPASGGTLNGAVPSANNNCPAGTTDIGNTPLPGGFAGTMDICQLAARYDVDGSTINLTNDNIYQLASAATQGTFIGDGDAAQQDASSAAEVVLNIEPGTLILGDAAAALSITRGSDINVNGTEEDPVVMSSLTWFNAWLAGGDGRSDRGEWGGLVITGFGIANQCNDVTFCDALVEGFINPFNYGGLDNTDDSGSISYLIIRQGGFDLDGNGSEINGLTLYTLGNNTSIDHVQVHKNVDDGIEFFGGEVVVTNAVLTGVGDDSIDSDLGFTGGVQYAVVKQFDDLADRGFEADSSGNPLDTPVSAPHFANITVMSSQGSESQSTSGMIARSTTAGYWWNGIIQCSERSCIRMDDDTLPTRGGVLGNPNDGTLQIHNYAISCDTLYEGSGGAGETDADVMTWYLADSDNQVIANPVLSGSGYPSPRN